MDFVLATGNKHKLKEISRILRMEIAAFSYPVKENGKTFTENAVKKARFACRKTRNVAIADDSGLEVDCLGGKPGVRSARFARNGKFCEKLLKAMRTSKNRKARFVCVIAAAYPDGKVKTFCGICRGKIINEMRGKNGFGYDPVFVPDGYKKTFAEMAPVFKNRISHRGKALRKLKERAREDLNLRPTD